MKARRHDLITLTAQPRFLEVSCQTCATATAYVNEWIAAGRPFVFPRQDDAAQRLQLGLVFIDAGVKHRALVKVDPDDVRRVDPPFRLDACLDAFSACDARILSALCLDMHASGLSLLVFGSLTWERIAGQPYRNTDSDLDLLCDVSTPAELETAVMQLRNADRQLSMRLDGELRLPDNACVNWREALQASVGETQQLLVKSERRVTLRSVDSLWTSSRG